MVDRTPRENGPSDPRFAALTSAVDLPASAYPFTITAHRYSDDEAVWTATVAEGPGVLKVPPLAGEHGPVYIVVAYADGAVERADVRGR